MNEIFFLVFAFLTIFLSIKLSYYADNLSRMSNISTALVGGIILAGVTSLPEFITCFSAIIVGNPNLAIGDILGSNIFNLFMVCFFDLFFIKKMIFCNTSRSHNLVLFILLINYLILYMFIKKIFTFNILSIGIPSIIIVLTYIFYIKSIPKFGDQNDNNLNESSSKLVIKLIITSLCMIISSVLLTVVVNNLSILHPSFSSSFLGAIFLGITTSLPEVVTFYTLVNINSYDLAFSNIVGSCLFNLLVLAIGDIFFFGYPLYIFSDNDTIIITILGILYIILSLIVNNRKKVKNLLSYGLISFLVVISYLFFWISKFW